ncbi:MAG: hypothetical protein A2Z74_04660 [Chloroflexi bacterium RBG_13_46_9]|nr:MAG: hypothetical protein A2Z74_04660 [Chloroflexi bacterium RBG_13_46_9]
MCTNDKCRKCGSCDTDNEEIPISSNEFVRLTICSNCGYQYAKATKMGKPKAQHTLPEFED